MIDVTSDLDTVSVRWKCNEKYVPNTTQRSGQLDDGGISKHVQILRQCVCVPSSRFMMFNVIILIDI